MQLKDIDLNLLVTFQAIYKERHLTRASFKLQRSPSAISHALNRLRSLLDDPLFVRQGNQMMPTPLSIKLGDEIEKGLTFLEDTLKDRYSFEPSRSQRSYIIGIMDYLASMILPDLIPAIKSEAPHITLQFKHIAYSERPAAMKKGDVDIIIGWEQQFSSNVFRQHIYSDHEVCICRHGHPRIGNKLTLKQYLKEEFITLYWHDYDKDPTDKIIASEGNQRKIALMVEHELIIPEIVSRSDYLANMGIHGARKFNKWVPINILPIPLSIPILKIYQHWHSRNQKDASHRWLRQKIKTVCQNLYPPLCT